MKHKHADMMMEYAKDAQVTNKPWELWEVANSTGDWVPLRRAATWNEEELAYRRKMPFLTADRKPLPEGKYHTICVISRNNSEIITLLGVDDWLDYEYCNVGKDRCMQKYSNVLVAVWEEDRPITDADFEMLYQKCI